MGRFNQHHYVSLSQGELNQIGTYFKRHYKQGKRVPIEYFCKESVGLATTTTNVDIHKFPLRRVYVRKQTNPEFCSEKNGFTSYLIRHQQVQENNPVDRLQLI